MPSVIHECTKPTNVHSVAAIHGLNGHPFTTWTTRGSVKMWLKDPSLLPSYLKNSRVLTYGYNAMIATVMGKTSSDRIPQHAQTLVVELVADRKVGLLGCLDSTLVTKTEKIAHFSHSSHDRNLGTPKVADTEGQLLNAPQEGLELL